MTGTDENGLFLENSLKNPYNKEIKSKYWHLDQENIQGVNFSTISSENGRMWKKENKAIDSEIKSVGTDS